MKNIWKVKPRSKRKIADILRLCEKGDIIFVYPGEYQFPTALELKSVKIVGVGNDPSEVEIKGGFVLERRKEVSISNLTIRAPHEGNAFMVRGHSALNLTKTTVYSELTGNYPGIFCEHQSHLHIEASEIYSPEGLGLLNGIHINGQSEAQILSSVITSLYVEQSNTQLHNNQIKECISLANDAVVNATGVLDFPENEVNIADYLLLLQSGSKGTFNLIDLHANTNFAHLEHSVFEVKELQIVDNHVAEVKYNAQSTVNVPEDKVNLLSKEEFDETMEEHQKIIDEINEKVAEMNQLIQEEKDYQMEHNEPNVARMEEIDKISEEIKQMEEESAQLLSLAKEISGYADVDEEIYKNKEELSDEREWQPSNEHETLKQNENMDHMPKDGMSDEGYAFAGDTPDNTLDVNDALDFNDTLAHSVDEEVYEVDGYSGSEKQQSGLEELQSLYGLDELKEQINEFINTVRYNQRRMEQGREILETTLHATFMGNPGTGKTTVARLLGRALYENGVIQSDTFVEVTRKDLVSPNIGETAKITQEILERSKGGILFIDEAYSLYSESGMDYGKEVVDTIIPFMEDNRHNMMIIFAGYTDEMNQFLKMNSGLQSRIQNNFYFDDYEPEEVAEIGYSNLLKQDYIVNEEKYKDVITWLYRHSIDKSNVRWVRSMNEQILKSHANRVIETDTTDTQTIVDEDLDVLVGNQKHNKEDKIQELLNELDSLIGLDIVQDNVHRLKKEAEFDRVMMNEGGDLSDKPSYHMIFAGNPGTGKTTVANIIAQLFYYLDIMPTSNVKVVDRSDLVGAYIGQTEKQTKEILEQAMGGVLFIDEAYQLAGKGDNDFGKQAIETLLTYLEDHRDKFIVILAGYTEEMEEFLEVNPGLRSRIPNKITFPDYSPDEVAAIVEKIITKNWEVNVSLLRDKVIDIYSNLPSNEKANGRWARNFSEKLIQNHKVWVSDQVTAPDNLRKISDDVIHGLLQEYAVSL